MISFGRIYLSTLIVMLSVLACSTEQDKTPAANDEWPEMDAFHMTMAEAFHPLKDSGNVEPALRLIGQLTLDADTWAASPIPDKVNNDDMKSKLDKLKTDIRALSDAVNDGAPEDQVGTALYIIHDQFHEIMEIWHSDKENSREKEH